MKTFSCFCKPALIPGIALLVAAFASLPPVVIAASDTPAAKPAKAALDTAVSRGNAVLSAKPALKKAQPF